MALAGGSLLVAGFGPDDPQVRVPAALDGSVVVAGHRYAAYRLVFIVVAAVLAAALYLACDAPGPGCWSARPSTTPRWSPVSA